MASADQRAVSADRALTAVDDQRVETWSRGPDQTEGADPGEPETWEIFRVDCPACDRPIALVGDEERLPQHAVLPTAWHPFSPALCPGSGLPADDLEESDPESVPDTATGLAELLTLPARLDWRTQPFSHAGTPGAAAAAAATAAAAGVGAPPAGGGGRVPPMRTAPGSRLVRQ